MVEFKIIKGENRCVVGQPCTISLRCKMHITSNKFAIFQHKQFCTWRHTFIFILLTAPSVSFCLQDSSPLRLPIGEPSSPPFCSRSFFLAVFTRVRNLQTHTASFIQHILYKYNKQMFLYIENSSRVQNNPVLGLLSVQMFSPDYMGSPMGSSGSTFQMHAGS